MKMFVCMFATWSVAKRKNDCPHGRRLLSLILKVGLTQFSAFELTLLWSTYRLHNIILDSLELIKKLDHGIGM